jgi:CBS domain-containing protein
MTTSIADTLDERRVCDVVRGSVVVAPAPTTVPALAALMVVHRIHGVVVAGDDDAQWVSDHDVLAAALAGVRDWRRADLPGVPTLTAQASLRAAAKALVKAGTSHAFVGRRADPTGVVSALDICAAAGGVTMRGVSPPASTTLSFEERRLDRVPARRVMHPGVVSAAPSTPLSALARTMADGPTHSVVVDGLRRDAGGEHLVWGVVTDLDIVRALAAGLDDAVASDIAGTEPLCVDADDRVDDVARRLREHDISHVIVTDAARRPCGVISTLDVLRVVAGGSGI